LSDVSCPIARTVKKMVCENAMPESAAVERDGAILEAVEHN
jgi:hypothetical protein